MTSDLTLSTLTDDLLDRRITEELILEDTLHFLLNSHTHLPLRAEDVGLTHTRAHTHTHTHV